MVKKIVGLMGGSVAGGSSKLATAEQIRSFLSLLASHQVKELDTARVYNGGRSEEILGELKTEVQRDHFQIATKAPGFSPGSLAYENVIKNCNASLAALKLEKMNLYYFHGPDSATPIEESLRAIHQLHQQGKFEKFGISNFGTDQVEKIVSICKTNGYVLPSVYQGGFNPFLRVLELRLLKVLRQHAISFYAYSPLGGGFFSRPTDELRTPPAGGRMDSMKVFKEIYVNDLSLELHADLSRACDQAGIPMKEATLRWFMHHSVLNDDDGVILGGSSEEQMEENLKACEAGPLPENIVASFENLWTRHYAERGLPPNSFW